MTGFENLTPEESLILTNAIVISLAKGKNADELNVLGNFFVGIIASQQEYLNVLRESRNVNSTQNNGNNNNNNNNNNNAADDDTIIG